MTLVEAYHSEIHIERHTFNRRKSKCHETDWNLFLGMKTGVRKVCFIGSLNVLLVSFDIYIIGLVVMTYLHPTGPGPGPG